MVNIALCIPGGMERQENWDAYLGGVSQAIAFCREEVFGVMQDTQETIKVFHGMSFNKGDDFGNGLNAMSDPDNEAYENIELVHIDIPSGSDRHDFVRSLAEKEISHVFAMKLHMSESYTPGVQKEVDALKAGGYREETEPKILTREVLINHYVPVKNIA